MIVKLFVTGEDHGRLVLTLIQYVETQVEKNWQSLRIIDDYNYHMGALISPTKLRGYYNCQLTVRRTWFPPFFWILDTVLVNSILLYRKVTNSDISGKEFSVNLAWELIKDTLVIEKSTSYDEASPQTLPETSSKGKRTVYVTKKFELPLTRLLDDEHFVEWKQKREACVYCRYLSQRGKKAVNYDNPHKATYSAPSVKYLSSVLSKDHTALKIFTRKKINGIILLFLSHSLHLIRFFF